MSLSDDDDLFDDEPVEYFRGVLAYPGNKFQSLSKLLPLIPKGDKYVEPCGGSGVVLMNLKHDYKLKVYNDRNAGVVAFYRCLQDANKCKQLIVRLEATCHSREEFIYCRDTWHQNQHDDIERAARWMYHVQMSFGSLGRNFARATDSNAQNDQALRNKFPIFDVVRSRFKGVQVENQDILKCLHDYCTTANCVTYIDPPYNVGDQFAYRDNVNHKTMLDFVHQHPGWFAISGYANELYDSYEWDQRHVWKVTTGIRHKEQTSDWHEREEVLWIRESR